jgi:hypothetical protein
MEILTYVMLALVVLAFIVTRIFRTRPTPKGIVIRNPVLGALNLEGLWVEDIVEKDLEILGPYFAEVRRSDDVPPLCDVLLLYGEINSSGALQNSPKPPNEIVRDAGASVVIIAINNPVENYSAMPKDSFESVTLIMTIDRRQWRFTSCLAKIFEQMKTDGVSLPLAWVKVGPQHPGAMHEDLPSLVCKLP